MTEKEKDVIRARCRLSLLDYIRFIDPTYIVDDMHRYIASILEDVEAGRRKRVIISTPPRHGKSTLVAQHFPAWVLARRPQTEIVASSYGHDLAARNVVACRGNFDNEKHQWVFGNIASPVAGSDRSDEFKVGAHLSRPGCMKACGVGSPLTGFGADILIVDDPVKDASEALSQKKRDNAWDWFTSTAGTRLTANGTGRVVVIMTRWHEDDLVGRLTHPDRVHALLAAGLTNEIYEVHNLAAEALPNDPLGRPVGAYLSPARFPAEKYKADKISAGRWWASLYQGSPAPDSGSAFPVDRVKFISSADLPKAVASASKKAFVDMAYSADGDRSALAWGVVVRSGSTVRDFYIFGIKSWRGEYAETKAKLQGMVSDLRRAGVRLLGTEANGPQKAVASDIKAALSPLGLGVTGFIPKGDKEARFAPVCSLAFTGNFHIILTGNKDVDAWASDFMEEARFFPFARHDDMVDSVSGLLAMFPDEGLSRSVPCQF